MDNTGFISNKEDVITLEYEDGSISSFEIMGKFDYEDGTYIALLSQENAEEAMLFGCEEEGDGFYLRMLDDEEFDAVWDEFERIIEEEW